MIDEPLFHVALHQPEIPQNTGNIGRTCVATRAKLWLVQPLGFRLNDHYLRRAGLDYWDDLQWEVVDNWSALTRSLQGRQFWLFSKRGKHVYSTVDYSEGDVFVFGSETQGLPASLLEAHQGQTVRLPMQQEVRSLNLACAVSVAVYEATRQIGFSQDQSAS